MKYSRKGGRKRSVRRKRRSVRGRLPSWKGAYVWGAKVCIGAHLRCLFSIRRGAREWARWRASWTASCSAEGNGRSKSSCGPSARSQVQVVGYALLLSAALSTPVLTRAQRFSEWFKQKKTQKQYSIKQVAGLAAYLQLLEAGYNTAKDGLWMVAALKEGDFMQHALHFQSMEMVSPVIKRCAKVMAIAELLDRDEAALKSWWAAVLSAHQSGQLSAHELQGAADYRQSCLEDLKSVLSRLEMLVTDHALIMTDDERIAGIDKLYQELKIGTSNQQRVMAAVSALISERQGVKKELEQLRRWLSVDPASKK